MVYRCKHECFRSFVRWYDWWHKPVASELVNIFFYASLAYIRHFIFSGCYDNDPWYLATNFAGHLDFAGHLELAGFYFSNAPLILNAPLNLLLGTRYRPSFSSCDGGRPNFKYIDFASVWTRAPLIETWCSTNELWMLYIFCILGFISQAHIHVLGDFLK